MIVQDLYLEPLISHPLALATFSFSDFPIICRKEGSSHRGISSSPDGHALRLCAYLSVQDSKPRKSYIFGNVQPENILKYLPNCINLHSFQVTWIFKAMDFSSNLKESFYLLSLPPEKLIDTKTE